MKSDTEQTIKLEQLYKVGSESELKSGPDSSPLSSIISHKLVIYVYRYKDANICRSLLQSVLVVIITYLIEFLALNKPLSPT